MRSQDGSILLAAYGGGHVNIIVPIYRHLVAEGAQVQVLGLTMAQERLKREKIPFLSISDFATKEDGAAIAQGEELCRKMSLHPAIPISETAAYMGLSYHELVLDHGEDQAHQLYASKGRQCFLPRRLANRILRAVKPGLVCTTNSPRMEKALILQAAELGIRSACISDFYDETEFRDRTARKGYGDRLFVPFEASRKALVKLGRPRDDIFVSGNPALDYLADPELQRRGQAKRIERGWQDKYVILWVKSAMGGLKAAEYEIELRLQAIAKKNSDTIIVARLHPNDPNKGEDQAELGMIVSDNREPLMDALLASDTVCTINSTVGLEANLLGRAVVQANVVKDFAEHVPFERLEIGRSINSVEGLEAAIHTNPSFGKLPPCMAVGKATGNVVDELLKLQRSASLLAK